MRRRVEDTYSTRATRATPFQYQGYSKATETRNSVFRECTSRTSPLPVQVLVLDLKDSKTVLRQAKDLSLEDGPGRQMV
jgi:hypothetical protein